MAKEEEEEEKKIGFSPVSQLTTVACRSESAARSSASRSATMVLSRLAGANVSLGSNRCEKRTRRKTEHQRNAPIDKSRPNPSSTSPHPIKQRDDHSCTYYVWSKVEATVLNEKREKNQENLLQHAILPAAQKTQKKTPPTTSCTTPAQCPCIKSDHNFSNFSGQEDYGFHCRRTSRGNELEVVA
jgi:hypothetical protein